MGMSRVGNRVLLKVVEFDKVTATSFTVNLYYIQMYDSVSTFCKYLY